MEPEAMCVYSSSPPPMEDGEAEEEEEDEEFGEFSSVPNSVSLTELDTTSSFSPSQMLTATSPPELNNSSMSDHGVGGSTKANGVVIRGQGDGGPDRTPTSKEIKHSAENPQTPQSLPASMSRRGHADSFTNGSPGNSCGLTNGFGVLDDQERPPPQGSVLAQSATPELVAANKLNSSHCADHENEVADFAEFYYMQSLGSNDDTANQRANSENHCVGELQSSDLNAGLAPNGRCGLSCSKGDRVVETYQADTGPQLLGATFEEEYLNGHYRVPPLPAAVASPNNLDVNSSHTSDSYDNMQTSLLLNGGIWNTPEEEEEGFVSQDSLCPPNGHTEQEAIVEEKPDGWANESETETETSLGRPLSTEALEEFGDISTTGSVPSPPLQEEVSPSSSPVDHSQMCDNERGAQKEGEHEEFGDFGDFGDFSATSAGFSNHELASCPSRHMLLVNPPAAAMEKLHNKTLEYVVLQQDLHPAGSSGETDVDNHENLVVSDNSTYLNSDPVRDSVRQVDSCCWTEGMQSHADTDDWRGDVVSKTDEGDWTGGIVSQTALGDWAVFGQQEKGDEKEPVVGKKEWDSWATFKPQLQESRASITSPGGEIVSTDHTPRQQPHTVPSSFHHDNSRTDRATAALLCRLERLFQTSFPVLPFAIPVEKEQEMGHQDVVVDLQSFLFPLEGATTTTESCSKGVRDVWKQLQDIHNAFGLQHQWGGSHSNKMLLCSLGIDTRNILFTGQKKQPVIVPMYAASLGMLEPTKEAVKPVSAAEMIASIAQLSSPAATVEDTSTYTLTIHTNTCSADDMQEALPPVQFDWSSSGLTNPLDASGGSSLLNLDFFGPVEETSSCGTSIPGVDPELYELTTSKVEQSGARGGVVDAFARLMSTVEKNSTATRKSVRVEENLSKEALHVMSLLPDLSFMQAKVLMFPTSLTSTTGRHNH